MDPPFRLGAASAAGCTRAECPRYNGHAPPNDLAPHPDGSVWFTDPPYGGALYEGAVDPAGGPGNAAGRINSRLGQAVGLGETKRELTTSNVYRVDASGKIEMAISQEVIGGAPNGTAFSPDHRKVYVVATGAVVGFDLGSDKQGKQSETRRQFHDRRRAVQPGRASSRRQRQPPVPQQRGKECGL